MNIKCFSIMASVIICLTMFVASVPQTNAQTLLGTFDDFERDWEYESGYYVDAVATYTSGYEKVEIDGANCYGSAGMNSENFVVSGNYVDRLVVFYVDFASLHVEDHGGGGYSIIEIKLYVNGSPYKTGCVYDSQWYEISGASVSIYHIFLDDGDNIDIDISMVSATSIVSQSWCNYYYLEDIEMYIF